MSEKRYRSLAVQPEDSGSRVESLLRRGFAMSAGMISALKWREDGILLDGVPVHTDVRVQTGQVLAARIDDAGQTNSVTPVPLPLTFVYEDEDLAVIDKPAGLAVHGSTANETPTLANALAACWGRELVFHPVHRLDRGTSGLLVVAKNAYVCDRLRRSLHTDDFIRAYLALVSGEVIPEAGEIELPIGPMDGERLRRCVRPDGQAARTAYETAGHFDSGTLLRLRLYTGRTHQIRVHLAAIGHPLLGDRLYGGPSAGLTRPALHAAFLRLKHPITGEMLELSSPLPADLQQIQNISHREDFYGLVR